MQIAIITRKDEAKWGGDLKALYTFYAGLKEIGQDVLIAKSAEEALYSDFIFLCNTARSLKEEYSIVHQNQKRFGIIGFHGDRSSYYSPCYGFAHFVGLCLAQQEGLSFFHLEQLLENPDIVHCFPYSYPSFFQDNFSILGQAETCIATSHTEALIMQRDCPVCNPKVVYLDCGLSDADIECNGSEFLRWTGLKTGEYALQVGRIELRKNQLGSILSMRNLDIPLVFIATETYYPEYEAMCIQAIKKYRTAPTFIISQNLPPVQENHLYILQMPEGKKLPFSMLMSAYYNAGLHFHPAFCELPGLTYLESAKLGIPTVASSWTTIRDYFTDPITKQYTLDDRMVYCSPLRINEMTRMVLEQFGKKVNKNFFHPLFQRTQADVGRDFLSVL